MAPNFPIDFGEYRLLRKLAQGGMAELFLAHNKKGEILAIKRILPHLAHEEGFIRMFIDEARIVQHIDHPNVAAVWDRGKSEGYYFMAMEYVQGHSLLALHDRARQMKIPLPRGLLAYVIAELLAGLSAAHMARDSKGRHLGIVHRDVTPQNVMISYEGDVKLIDFGVAKARARLTKTEAGFTKGKLAYMSPEQARGEELDGRSDLFSVGIVLWEVTTGYRLFNKEGPGGILSAIVNDPIPEPSSKVRGYPRDLETIVMKALEKDVNRRFQNADQMRDALMRYAKKERPSPGKNRLADLIHDLFGDPKHKELIDEAKSFAEPTPAGPVKAEMIRGASVRMQGTKVETDTRVPRADETRMMDIPESVELQALSRPQVTSAGTPSLGDLEPSDLHGAHPVPEPRVPARVKIGRTLASFAEDVGLSYGENRRRYLAAVLGIGVLLIVGVGWISGAASSASAWLKDLTVQAKQLKQQAGLDETKVDAGLAPTVLVLATDPPGAMVEIDGIGAGCVTPCELSDSLKLGRPFEVTFKSVGYRPHVEELTLLPHSGRREISVALEKEVGGLFVESEPEGATVIIDGKSRGLTPLNLSDLKAGEPVNITVRARGYLSKSKVVVLADGEVKRERIVLEIDKKAIPNGRIAVRSSPTGCPVSIDGSAVGVTPLSGQLVRPGQHTVTVACEFHDSVTRSVDVEPERTRKVEIEPSPNVFGYLTLRLVPARGTTVKVNGRPVSLPVEFLKVVPGRHNVEVENGSLDKKEAFSLTVHPNERVTRKIDLMR